MSNPYVHTLFAVLVLWVLPVVLKTITNPVPGSKLDVLLRKAMALGFDPVTFAKAVQDEVKTLGPFVVLVLVAFVASGCKVLTSPDVQQETGQLAACVIPKVAAGEPVLQIVSECPGAEVALVEAIVAAEESAAKVRASATLSKAGCK